MIIAFASYFSMTKLAYNVWYVKAHLDPYMNELFSINKCCRLRHGKFWRKIYNHSLWHTAGIIYYTDRQHTQSNVTAVIAQPRQDGNLGRYNDLQLHARQAYVRWCPSGTRSLWTAYRMPKCVNVFDAYEEEQQTWRPADSSGSIGHWLCPDSGWVFFSEAAYS